VLVEKEDWSFIKLDNSYIGLYEKRIRSIKDVVIYEIVGIESGIHVVYKFKKEGREYTLVEVVNKTT